VQSEEDGVAEIVRGTWEVAMIVIWEQVVVLIIEWREGLMHLKVFVNHA